MRLHIQGLYMSEKTLEQLSEFATLSKQIEDMRIQYALKQNGWVEAAFANDPALAKYGSAENLRAAIKDNPDNVELTRYPGLTVMAAHELANELYNKAIQHPQMPDGLAQFAQARAFSEVAASMSGADIHPGAQINPNLFVDHDKGVVIGETAIVGKDCFLLHGVTLGGGNTKKGNRRHPELGDGVEIGSNSNIYGACNIGDNVKISTGAIIIDSDIGDGTKINAKAQITKSIIRANVKIYPDAQVFDCEIGEGAVIGAGVRLDKVKIPAYARVCDVQQPKLVIYDASHEGVVTARGQNVAPKSAYPTNAEKTITAPVFAQTDAFQNVENWQDKLAAYATQKAGELSAILRQ